MYLHFSFLCVILVFVVSRVPRFLFLFCPTRMGHGWTIVGCDFFLPPLGAPPVIFKPEDSTELTSPHQDSAEIASRAENGRFKVASVFGNIY